MIELMDCATLGVYKAGLGHTVKNVNNALSFFVLSLFLVNEVLCTIIMLWTFSTCSLNVFTLNAKTKIIQVNVLLKKVNISLRTTEKKFDINTLYKYSYPKYFQFLNLRSSMRKRNIREWLLWKMRTLYSCWSLSSY